MVGKERCSFREGIGNGYLVIKIKRKNNELNNGYEKNTGIQDGGI